MWMESQMRNRSNALAQEPIMVPDHATLLAFGVKYLDVLIQSPSEAQADRTGMSLNPARPP